MTLLGPWNKFRPKNLKYNVFDGWNEENEIKSNIFYEPKKIIHAKMLVLHLIVLCIKGRFV